MFEPELFVVKLKLLKATWPIRQCTICEVEFKMDDTRTNSPGLSLSRFISGISPGASEANYRIFATGNLNGYNRKLFCGWQR